MKYYVITSEQKDYIDTEIAYASIKIVLKGGKLLVPISENSKDLYWEHHQYLSNLEITNEDTN